ncbi:response regulator transcription factor [Arthrobacter roseus]|uniref:response regulator transcription factor n=1 Tax=Arthrobacter roseus TaxID=136274 RepID=UPI001965F1C2|nr:response regulator transcription factor [Arthrobacter roseus]MBM7849760.1 DNA-binding response OmpR family regulator [Arthrobacter roseus]
MLTSPEYRSAVIVDDDQDIRELLTATLESNGFTILTSGTGRHGVELIREHNPDLITLDLNLPDIDGVEVCRQARAMTDAYIVMVTARQDEIDRLIGLEIGADDFLVKPFSPRELQARVAAMFRRPRTSVRRADTAPIPAVVEPSPEPEHTLLRHGPLAVDIEGRIASLDEEELSLTRTEFDLLATLLSAPRRVWSRESLLAKVWGEAWVSDQHLVEVHMRNLRKKLGDKAADPRFIRTVRGVGYRLMPGGRAATALETPTRSPRANEITPAKGDLAAKR